MAKNKKNQKNIYGNRKEEMYVLWVNLRKRETFPADKQVFLSEPKVLMTSLLAGTQANLSVSSVVTQPSCRCEFFPTSKQNIPHQHSLQFSPPTPNTKTGTVLKIGVPATAPLASNAPLHLLPSSFLRHEHSLHPSEQGKGHQHSRWQRAH